MAIEIAVTRTKPLETGLKEGSIGDWNHGYRNKTRLSGFGETMRSNFTQLYLHCVWATWDRLPLITSDIQSAIYAGIVQKCNQLNCTLIAIGGVQDHVHLLTGIPPTLCVSDLIKGVKGSSSHLITHAVEPGKFFKWQGSYGAFTVSRDDIDRVANYIRNQAEHHQQKTTIVPWEIPLPATH